MYMTLPSHHLFGRSRRETTVMITLQPHILKEGTGQRMAYTGATEVTEPGSVESVGKGVSAH